MYIIFPPPDLHSTNCCGVYPLTFVPPQKGDTKRDIRRQKRNEND